MLKKKQLYMLEALIVILIITILGWKTVPMFLSAQNINTPKNFPDPNFRAIVETYLMIPPDGKFTAKQAANFTDDFNISYQNIEYATGIEFFTNITELSAHKNKLKHIDLSHNTKLTKLRIHDNQLSTLDLTANSNLEEVWIYQNKIQTLQLPKKMALRYLIADGNMLSTLYMPHCPNLEILECSNNRITSIDVFKLPNLTALNAQHNLLLAIDLSNNPKLKELNLSNNMFHDLPNLSHNPLIGRLDIQMNRLNCEDLTDILPLENQLKQHNPNLTFDYSIQTGHINLSKCIPQTNKQGEIK